MAFLRPSFIDNMGWEMARVYGAVTDQILINLAKYFPYWTSSTVPKSAFEYQAVMLAQMGKVNRETIKIIRQGLKGADETLENVIEQAIMEAVSKSEPGLIDAVKKGILHPVGRPIVAPNQMKAFDLYYEQAAQKLNLVNTVMLESTKQAYQATVSDIAARVQATQTALDIGAGEAITGVSSWNTAMVHAINRMKQNGIVGFVDHGGHRWSAEAYTAMDIRTTVANTARAAVWETNQNFGNDLYMVSYHDGARPLCYPYQNKVISASNQFGVTYDLDGNEIEYIAQSATTYGQPAGLFGINCKHYPTPFIPGVSVITGDPQGYKENERAYKESQQQRALERKIREEKRDLLMLNAQGAPDDVIKAQRAKIRATDDEIDAFCDETGRARRQNREGAYTSRVFPDPDTYDVGEFERKQKDEIEEYFKNGGVQQNYTFGQMNTGEQEPPTSAPEAPITQTPETPVVNNAPTQETPQSTFTPAKTREEAEKYARERFADNVDLKGISVANANDINSTLTELTEKYPTNRLENLVQEPKGSVARARYNRLAISGKKLGKVLDEETQTFIENQKYMRNQIEELKQRYAGKAKIPEGIQKQIDQLETKLQHKRYSVISSYPNHVRGVITHEYGHILSDQYFGMINGESANPNIALNWSIRRMSTRWDEVYNMALKNGDIFKLSQYGSSNVKEFFAECFAARELGEQLPDYISSLMDEVLKNGIMR